MATWTVDSAGITAAPDGSGGFTLTVPLQADGTHVADLKATMTAAAALELIYRKTDPAGALTGFEAWSTSS